MVAIVKIKIVCKMKFPYNNIIPCKKKHVICLAQIILILVPTEINIIKCKLMPL